MIKVGINENVRLKGAEINDKGTLVISFTQDGVSAPQVDLNDILNQTAETKAFDGSTSIMLFAPSVEYNGEKRAVKDIAASLGGFRDQLQHLLQGYLTTAEASLDPYVGIDTSDPMAFQSSLQNQTTIDRIYKNLATGFLAKLKSIQDRLETEKFRLLLIRRSTANHYGRLRDRFISTYPFWESMNVPATQSNLRFSNYEINKGLNSGEPVSKDATSTAAVVEDNAAGDILGSR